MCDNRLIIFFRLGITSLLVLKLPPLTYSQMGFMKMNSMRFPTFGEFRCPEPGLFPVKYDCRKYYKCMFSGMNAFGVVSCPGKQKFDPVDRRCDRPDTVDCQRCASDGLKPERQSSQHYVVCTNGFGTRNRCYPPGTNFDPVSMRCPEVSARAPANKEPKSESTGIKSKSGSHASAKTDVRGGAHVIAGSRNEGSGATALASSEGTKSSQAMAMANFQENGTARARAHSTADQEHQTPTSSNNSMEIKPDNRTSNGDSETWNSRTLATAFNENGMTASAMAEGKGQSSAQATQNETLAVAESETLGAQGGAVANNTKAQTWSSHDGTNGSMTIAMASNNESIVATVSDANGSRSTNISESSKTTTYSTLKPSTRNKSKISRVDANNNSGKNLDKKNTTELDSALKIPNKFDKSNDTNNDTNLSRTTTTSKPVVPLERMDEMKEDHFMNKTLRKRSAKAAPDSEFTKQPEGFGKPAESKAVDRFPRYDSGIESRFADMFSRDSGTGWSFDTLPRSFNREFGNRQPESRGMNTKQVTDSELTASSSKTKKSSSTSYQSMTFTTEVNGTKQTSKSEFDTTNTGGSVQNQQVDSKTRTEVIKKDDETVNVAHEQVAANETVIESKAAIVESHVQTEESKAGKKVGELKTNQATAESETYFDRIAVQSNTTNSTLSDFEKTQKDLGKIENTNNTEAEAGTHTETGNTTKNGTTQLETEKQESSMVGTQLTQGSRTNEIQNSRGSSTQNLTHQDSKASAQVQSQVQSKSDTSFIVANDTQQDSKRSEQVPSRIPNKSDTNFMVANETQEDRKAQVYSQSQDKPGSNFMKANYAQQDSKGSIQVQSQIASQSDPSFMGANDTQQDSKRSEQVQSRTPNKSDTNCVVTNETQEDRKAQGHSQSQGKPDSNFMLPNDAQQDSKGSTQVQSQIQSKSDTSFMAANNTQQDSKEPSTGVQSQFQSKSDKIVNGSK